MNGMDGKNETLFAEIGESVEKLGYECVHVGLATDGPGQGVRLRVLIDSLGGINLEDCERVSRAVDRVLDRDDIQVGGGGSYALEISSPGVERPLFRLSDYERFTGREARVRLGEPVEGRKSITGTIVRAGDGTVTLYAADEEREITLPFEAIKAGNLTFHFDGGEPKKKNKGKSPKRKQHDEEER